jgi:hypothetical protein
MEWTTLRGLCEASVVRCGTVGSIWGLPEQAQTSVSGYRRRQRRIFVAGAQG